MTLGNRLYEMRKSKKMSQEQVAEALGVTRQTVSKWETDQTTPDFDKIIPLCELYGITSEELLKGKHKTVNSSNDNDNYNADNNNYYKSEEFCSNDEELRSKYRKRSALFTAIAVCLYILSVIPFFIFDSSKMMMSTFFVIIAVATMLIVFGAMSKPKRLKESEFQTKETKLIKQIASILSGITLVVYMLISFLTNAWHITWLLWVIYGIICEIIKLIFSLKGDKNNGE